VLKLKQDHTWQRSDRRRGMRSCVRLLACLEGSSVCESSNGSTQYSGIHVCAQRAYLSNVFWGVFVCVLERNKFARRRIGNHMEFLHRELHRIMRAFEKFDTNGNGSLSIAELKAVLKRPGGGRPLTDEDVAEIIADYDVNGDGELQLSEFALMWGPYFEGATEETPPPQPRAAGMHAKLHMPLNQGQAGTCVGYAFAAAVSHNLLARYGVPVDPEKIADKVKTLCPCWGGHWPGKMCDEWNAKHNEPGAYLEDMEKSAQYSINVVCKQLADIEKTYEKMKRVQGTMTLVCVIKTDAVGHELHAVALTNAYKGKPNMYATNSWGANQALMDVTRANFHSAFVVVPGIVAVQKNAQKAPVPPLRLGWTEKVEDQVDESDTARLRRENALETARLRQENALETARLRRELASEREKPRVGQSVRIVGGEHRKGETGTIIEDDGSGTPFKVKFSDSNTTWFLAANVALAGS